MPWKPGGGALVLTANGGWTLETFEPFFDEPLCDPSATPTCDPDVISKLGYNEFRAGGEARWRFLPRTSAVLEGGWFSRQPTDAAAVARRSRASTPRWASPASSRRTSAAP